MWTITRNLLQDLENPDPPVRVRTLQVLVMLEETLALEAVQELAAHDPDERVRQFAQNAVKHIAAAKQRGYTTDAALRQHFGIGDRPVREADPEQRLINSLIVDLAADPTVADELTYLRAAWERVDAVADVRAPLPPPSPSMAVVPQPRDEIEFLDEGLSAEFREYMRRANATQHHLD